MTEGLTVREKTVIDLNGKKFDLDMTNILDSPIPTLLNLIPRKIDDVSFALDTVRLNYKQLKDQIDIRYSGLYLTIKKTNKKEVSDILRQDPKAKNLPKLSEDELKHRINCDIEYTTLKNSLNDLSFYKDRLGSAMQVILAKKDLISIAMNSRILDPTNPGYCEPVADELVTTKKQPITSQDF